MDFISVANLIEALRQLDPSLDVHAIRFQNGQLLVDTNSEMPDAAIVTISDTLALETQHAELVRRWNAMLHPAIIDLSCVPGHQWAQSAHGWKAHLFSDEGFTDDLNIVSAACLAKLQTPLRLQVEGTRRCSECSTRAEELLRAQGRAP